MKGTLAIVGVTGTGKSSFAARLALESKGQIVSLDQSQTLGGFPLLSNRSLNTSTPHPFRLLHVKGPRGRNPSWNAHTFCHAAKALLDPERLNLIEAGNSMYMRFMLDNVLSPERVPTVVLYPKKGVAALRPALSSRAASMLRRGVLFEGAEPCGPGKVSAPPGFRENLPLCLAEIVAFLKAGELRPYEMRGAAFRVRLENFWHRFVGRQGALAGRQLKFLRSFFEGDGNFWIDFEEAEGIDLAALQLMIQHNSKRPPVFEESDRERQHGKETLPFNRTEVENLRYQVNRILEDKRDLLADRDRELTPLRGLAGRYDALETGLFLNSEAKVNS